MSLYLRWTLPVWWHFAYTRFAYTTSGWRRARLHWRPAPRNDAALACSTYTVAVPANARAVTVQE